MEKITKENLHFDSPSSIFVTDVDCPETFPPHWHSAAEFTVALVDGCKYKVNNTLYELSSGDVLLVWPQQIHETVKIPHCGVIFIQFPSLILDNNLDLVSISRFLYTHHHLSAKDYPELTGFIKTKIDEIKKIHNSTDVLSETRCKLCIYDILLKISEHVISERSKDSNIEKISGSGRLYIRSACNYIIENSSDKLTQEDVAKHIGLSTFYFSKLFNQYMNTSFAAYLANIRVKTATTLLLDDNLSITECAFMAGFQSTTSFNRVFHEITGYSPREYRKLYR